MKKVISLFLCLYSLHSFSQAPMIAWQKLIGGNNMEDAFYSFNYKNGNLFLVASSNSNISGDKTENSRGSYDYWMVKADVNGAITWDKTMGAGAVTTFGPDTDIVSSVFESSDGRVLVGGFSESNISGEKTEVSRGDYDYWILNLNSDGDIQWDKTLGGEGLDTVTDFFETTDGNYVVAGTSQSSITGDKTEASRGGADLWILKLNISGNIIWQKAIGGSGFDILTKIVPTVDNGFIVASSSTSNISGEKTENSYGAGDFWIIKLDVNGVIQWQKTLGGSGVDSPFSIIKTVDGGYIVGGRSNSSISGLKTENSRGLYDFWIVKLTATGEIMWQKTIGGSNDDTLTQIHQCIDNGYIITGTTLSPISGDKTEATKGDYDAWVVKVDENGNIQWQKDIGGSNYDGLEWVTQLADGSFILGGGSNSSNSFDITETNHGQNDIWVVKLNPENLATTGFEVLQNANLYPNPTYGIITIDFESLVDNFTVTVSNLLGQNISKDDFSNLSTLQIPIVGQSGVYFVTIQTKLGARKVFKVIKD
ncbi:T9SS type A sorting domain-containing protein [Flavobacterium sp.]|uniref:T9SS type A sorting domain-containing protein n=1 Tax=Flavobacterium sp. TaxID=239 RepID=UPI00391DEF1A